MRTNVEIDDQVMHQAMRSRVAGAATSFDKAHTSMSTQQRFLSAVAEFNISCGNHIDLWPRSDSFVVDQIKEIAHCFGWLKLRNR